MCFDKPPEGTDSPALAVIEKPHVVEVGRHHRLFHIELRILEGEQGTGEFWLDLDYILEWLPPQTEDGNFRIRIAPAVLVFHEVTSLRVAIDYAASRAAIGPFSLGGIEREPFSYPNGYESFRWTLEIACPSGEIAFEAPGFIQHLTGRAVETDSQQLNESQRGGDPPVT